MFTRLAMLGDGSCQGVVEEVLRQRAHWVRRAPETEFYTFGAASYLDRAGAYDALAAATNPILLDRFAPLYAHLCERLAAVLDEPVVFAEGKAVPGFHLWGVPGIPTSPCASLHFDLQYQRLRWPDSAREGVARSLSFTLPLRLPRGGGGLSVWNTTFEQVEAFVARTGFRGTLDDVVTLLDERRESYLIGELVLHSGHVLHRIAPIAEVAPDDLRVTLQGHGLHHAGAWHLYW